MDTTFLNTLSQYASAPVPPSAAFGFLFVGMGMCCALLGLGCAFLLPGCRTGRENAGVLTTAVALCAVGVLTVFIVMDREDAPSQPSAEEYLTTALTDYLDQGHDLTVIGDVDYDYGTGYSPASMATRPATADLVAKTSDGRGVEVSVTWEAPAPGASDDRVAVVVH